jgi:tRNA (adenine22-N1)-methyltransferase
LRISAPTTGRLPVWLLQNGRIASALAADIRPGPLESARRTAAEAGVYGIRFLLCDGLEGVGPDEADTVVIAGMGGDNITEILRRAPWVGEGVLLLLQPMTKAEELGAAFRCSALPCSTRCWPPKAAGCTRSSPSGVGDLQPIRRGSSTPAFARKSPPTRFFPRRLEELISQTAAALAGMERAPSRDFDRLSRLRRAYADFIDMREKARAANDADGDFAGGAYDAKCL